MKVFGNVIIQTVFIDMAASAFMTLFQLTEEVNNGIIFLGSGNSWLPLSGQWRCLPVMVFGVVNNVSFWSVPIQAIYRYIIIVRKKQISQWYPLIIFLTVGLFISAVTFPAVLVATVDSPSLEKLQSMGFWKGENTRVLCSLDVVSWPVFVYLTGMLILGNIGITMLLWFNKQLNKTLNCPQMHFSPKTQQAHKEISRMLYIQAVIPSVMNVFLVAIGVSVFFIPEYYGGLMVALLLPYPWIIVINPLVTLCCIKQYRNVFIRIFKWRRITIKIHVSVSRGSKHVTTAMYGDRHVVYSE
uniref:G_PROTEIN_RECEP_F1_2 domain-containing protein n=1 Tax=Panagrellus redivivus TaxID=6233 RepID=A0A7E4WDR1_PANRE